MKPGAVGAGGYPVRTAVTTPETRMWERRARQILVGKTVDNVFISNSTIYIVVDDGSELSLAYDGALMEEEHGS